MSLAHRFGRLWRRLGGRPDGEVSVIYNRRYRLEFSGLPQDPRRGEKVLSHLAGLGLVHQGEIQTAPRATVHDLCRVHAHDYLESLADAETLTRILGVRLSQDERDRVLEVQRRMVGGTLLAQRLARDHGGIAVNLGGGLHHAFRNRGERLCLVNDVAVAVAAARADGFTAPVLIVDLDLHDGDGTRALFADDESVHTFSIHNASSGTDSEAVASTSIELGSGVGDDLFLSTLHRHLPPVMEAVQPGLTVYLAGTDVAADDTLGHWELTGDGILARDIFVTRQLRSGGRRERAPMVVVLAGGYGRESWRHTGRFMTWLLSGEKIEPPTSDEALLRHYRQLSSLFSPEDLTGEPSPAEDDGGWDLSEEDVMGALGGAPKQHRFLGYYSLHGLELALERTGFLNLLRRRGFPEPTLELDLDNPAGETLRLFASPKRRAVLMELRARRDPHLLEGFELLRIEWLLLQDPQREFTEERPALPGQRHPGLGLLEDAVALLILVCERLDLDGLYFIPSHYHLAAQSRGLLHFLQPTHEALFQKLERVMDAVSLGRATRAVEAGEVITADGEPFRFPAMPMVLPVSETLLERLESEAYKASVKAELAEGQTLRLRAS